MPDDAPGRDARSLFSVEAEQAVLGALMLDNTAYDRIVGLVALDDFYTDDHRTLYRSIAAIVSDRRQADVVTVAETLRAAGDLDRVGGLAYLQQLQAATPSAANIRHYAEIVRDRAVLRRVILSANRMADLAREANGLTGREVLDQAHRLLVEIESSAANGRAELQHIAASVTRALEQLDEAAKAHKTKGSIAVSTSFARLDEKTGGMSPGQLIVVAGRPGMGKSAIALNIARDIAIRQGRAVGYFSMEMSNEELTTRLIADLGNLHGLRASHGRISDAEWQAIGTAGSAVAGAPMYLNDSAALTITEITASARRLAREASGSRLSLIVVDYLGLMRTERQTSNRAQDIAEVSRGLKALAKELKLPVMLLAQLNRECEKRADKRPVLSDLRDSGEIEADADMVWMLYRDEVYHDRDDNRGHAEVLIRKQRNGPIGMVKLRYDGARTRFSDWDEYP